MGTIKLNGEIFPFAVTSEGEKLLPQLNVNERLLEYGSTNELLKYAYCMCAGATRAEKKDFQFTLEQFRLACPGNWKQLTEELRNQPVKKEKKKKTGYDVAMENYNDPTNF